jgi:hypothetical protein
MLAHGIEVGRCACLGYYVGKKVYACQVGRWIQMVLKLYFILGLAFSAKVHSKCDLFENILNL